MPANGEVISNKEAKLTITLDAMTGQVNVSGPINDRLLCFGMMELAKQAINDHAKAQQSQILVARPKIIV